MFFIQEGCGRWQIIVAMQEQNFTFITLNLKPIFSGTFNFCVIFFPLPFNNNLH